MLNENNYTLGDLLVGDHYSLYRFKDRNDNSLNGSQSHKCIIQTDYCSFELEMVPNKCTIYKNIKASSSSDCGWMH